VDNLFLRTYLEQIGVPLPAAPVLLAAGALAGTGHLNIWISALAATALDPRSAPHNIEFPINLPVLSGPSVALGPSVRPLCLCQRPVGVVLAIFAVVFGRVSRCESVYKTTLHRGFRCPCTRATCCPSEAFELR
jgi:hypothetical protein